MVRIFLYFLKRHASRIGLMFATVNQISSGGDDEECFLHRKERARIFQVNQFTFITANEIFLNVLSGFPGARGNGEIIFETMGAIWMQNVGENISKALRSNLQNDLMSALDRILGAIREIAANFPIT